MYLVPHVDKVFTENPTEVKFWKLQKLFAHFYLAEVSKSFLSGSTSGSRFKKVAENNLADVAEKLMKQTEYFQGFQGSRLAYGKAVLSWGKKHDM